MQEFKVCFLAIGAGIQGILFSWCWLRWKNIFRLLLGLRWQRFLKRQAAAVLSSLFRLQLLALHIPVFEMWEKALPIFILQFGILVDWAWPGRGLWQLWP